MSAEIPLRAAALLRGRAIAAQGDRPEWFTDEDGYGDLTLWATRGEGDHAPQPVLSEGDLRQTPDVFAHLAALTPAVALAAAVLLEEAAEDTGHHPDESCCALCDFARTYLGESA